MTFIRRISIAEWRTFGQRVNIECPYPENNRLGMTVVVGRNNAGKSTIVQAFRMFVGNEKSISIPKSERRSDLGIKIGCELVDGTEIQIAQSTSGAAHLRSGERISGLRVLESRRPWLTTAGGSNSLQDDQFWQISSARSVQFDQRNDWTYQNTMSLIRDVAVDPVKKAKFNGDLKIIFPFINDWRLENDLGRDFIEYQSDAGLWHSISVTGEGILNTFILIAALYMNGPDDVVVVDEPELSLHPQAQRRLLSYLLQKAKTVQIIVATHSPYLVSWEGIERGMKVYRVSPGVSAKCGTLSDSTRSGLTAIAVSDFRNRRLFDTLSREMFFSDKVIFVEGFEDVALLTRFAHENSISNIEFFGYGASGAENIEKWLQACRELGVTAGAIYDKNKAELATRAAKNFPEFSIQVLPTDDIRDKPERDFHQKGTTGIFRADGTVKPEYADSLKTILSKLI